MKLQRTKSLEYRQKTAATPDRTKVQIATQLHNDKTSTKEYRTEEKSKTKTIKQNEIKLV